MAQNFIAGDREQALLMPPSLREWLPEGHLAWFVLDAVEELDLAAFYGDYRADGNGRPAHDPAVIGVPPLSWTLDRWAVWPGSKDRCPCRQPRRIRLSSAARRSA